jgi:hypothetical protein
MERKGCHGASRNKIIMSGNTALIDKEKAEKLGCKIIQKPVRFNVIEQVLEDCMDQLDPEEILVSL